MKTPLSTSLLSEDIAAIKAVSKSFVEAVNSNDWVSLITTYSEHTVLMPPNSPEVEGRANILAFFEAFPPTSDFSLEIVEIEGRGDMAYVRGTYTMTFTPEEGNSITDSGKYLEIRRKQADGSWLLSRDMFNSDIEQEH